MNDFLDNIFSNDNFIIILIVILVILFILFILILFLGKKDQKLEETKRFEMLEETRKLNELNNTTVNNVSTNTNTQSINEKYPDILIPNSPSTTVQNNDNVSTTVVSNAYDAVSTINNDVNVSNNESNLENTISINDLPFNNSIGENQSFNSVTNEVEVSNNVPLMPNIEESVIPAYSSTTPLVTSEVSTVSEEKKTTLPEPDFTEVKVVDYDEANKPVDLQFADVNTQIDIPSIDIEDIKNTKVSENKGSYTGKLNSSSVFSSVYVKPKENNETVVTPILEETEEKIVIPDIKENVNTVAPEMQNKVIDINLDDDDIDLNDMPTLKVEKAVDVKLPDLKSINLSNINKNS